MKIVCYEWSVSKGNQNTYPTNVILLLNVLAKHVTETNHLKLHQAIKLLIIMT